MARFYRKRAILNFKRGCWNFSGKVNKKGISLLKKCLFGGYDNLRGLPFDLYDTLGHHGFCYFFKAGNVCASDEVVA